MIKKLLLAIFLLTTPTASVLSQINPEKAVLTARDQFSDIKNRSIELERMKRESYKRSVSENFTLKFPAIKEDFERIQKINTDDLRSAFAKTPLSYPAISKLVSEINHRAARLKSNLFTDEVGNKREIKNNRQTIEQMDFETLFKSLDESINSFVHNPIFQNINLVNLKDSLKAQNDLETIINLSSTIKTKTKH